MNKQNRIFYVDTREPANIKSEISEFFGSTLKLEFRALQFGDFIYDGICIERKTYPDFIHSVKTTSFWRKLKETKENFENTFLYLEGEELDLIEVQALSKAKIKRIYKGSIIAVQLMNIPVLKFRTFTKFLEFLALVVKKSNEKEKKKESEEKDLFIDSHRKKGKTFSELRIESLSCIPGIGSKTAFDLIQTYGTIDKIVHLSEEDKDKNKGRKRKLITRIQEFFL